MGYTLNTKKIPLNSDVNTHTDLIICKHSLSGWLLPDISITASFPPSVIWCKFCLIPLLFLLSSLFFPLFPFSPSFVSFLFCWTHFLLLFHFKFACCDSITALSPILSVSYVVLCVHFRVRRCDRFSCSLPQKVFLQLHSSDCILPFSNLLSHSLSEIKPLTISKWKRLGINMLGCVRNWSSSCTQGEGRGREKKSLHEDI